MKAVICGIFIACLCLTAQAQNYRVQVATYEKGVNLDYFKQLGVTDPIVQSIDQNGLYKYYIRAKYVTQSEAIQAQESVISLGFKNARVIDIKQAAAACAKTPCGSFVGDDTFSVPAVTNSESIPPRNIVSSPKGEKVLHKKKKKSTGFRTTNKVPQKL